jgi:hypothetical protein
MFIQRGILGNTTGLWIMLAQTGALRGIHVPYLDGNVYDDALFYTDNRADNHPPGVSLDAWRVYETQYRAPSAPYISTSSEWNFEN